MIQRLIVCERQHTHVWKCSQLLEVVSIAKRYPFWRCWVQICVSATAFSWSVVRFSASPPETALQSGPRLHLYKFCWNCVDRFSVWGASVCLSCIYCQPTVSFCKCHVRHMSCVPASTVDTPPITAGTPSVIVDAPSVTSKTPPVIRCRLSLQRRCLSLYIRRLSLQGRHLSQ
jgi:hypothetical protein